MNPALSDLEILGEHTGQRSDGGREWWTGGTWLRKGMRVVVLTEEDEVQIRDMTAALRSVLRIADEDDDSERAIRRMVEQARAALGE